MSETTTTGGRARKAGYDYDRDVLRGKLGSVDRTPDRPSPTRSSRSTTWSVASAA
nr:hypothetical protein GCM10025699_66760 [Microbacterium flavescens]